MRHSGRPALLASRKRRPSGDGPDRHALCPGGATPCSRQQFRRCFEFDRQELVNALDQASREIGARYDLKDTGAHSRSRKTASELASASEFTLDCGPRPADQRAVKRNLSPKVFDCGKVDEAGGTARQTVKLRQGIDQDLARTISKLIRDKAPKVKPQIQGDAVQVTGENKDDLQAVIKLLREQDYTVPLQFNNYR